MTSGVVADVRAALRAGVPVLEIVSADLPGLIGRLGAEINGGRPVLLWDCVRGLSGVNAAGVAEVRRAVPPPEFAGAPAAGAALVDAIGLLVTALVDDAVLLVSLGHRTIADSLEGTQAVLTARDWLKSAGKALILLSSRSALPAEIAGDVLCLTDPLPSEAEIATTIATMVTAAQAGGIEVPDPDPATVTGACSALVGATAYAAEQAISLSIVQRGRIDVSDLWSRKRAIVARVPGLSMESSGLTLADVGGLSQIGEYVSGLMSGPAAPRVLVRWEEVEKSVAGFAADSSGVTQSTVGSVLTVMEDRGWTGAIIVGPPGCGKSLISKAAGGSFGVPTLVFDLGATKNRYVGASESQAREALDVISAIGGDRVFVVGTANDIQAIPAALKRRFCDGVWFSDLPTATERDLIWPIQLRAVGLPIASARPADAGWSGADIRNCCRAAFRLGVTLLDAARYIAPVSASDPEGVDRLRRLAVGRWLSVSYGGFYRGPEPESAPVASSVRAFKGGQ